MVTDMQPQDFDNAVRERFAFLGDYGFRRIGDRFVAPEAWIEFQSDKVEIAVHHELGSGPWVELAARGRPHEGLDLQFVLEVRAPEEVARLDALVTGGRDLDALGLLAAALREHARDLLCGDTSVLETLRPRADARARARDLELFGQVAPPPSEDAESE